MRVLAVVSLIYFLGLSETHSGKLETLLQWKVLEFDYDEEQRQADIDSGFYVPTTPMPIDVDVLYNNDSSRRIFVTSPRFFFGIPSTLSEYIGENTNGTPTLRPYPSWDWHRNATITQCERNRLVNVFRVKIDKCGRMWVLDDGKYADYTFCSPQILAFDLATNEVVHRFIIPDKFYIRGYSLLVTPIVDIRDNKCDEGFIYIADLREAGILTYNIKTRVISRATHRTMYPNPYYGVFNVVGYKYDAMDGVLGMDLEPYKEHSERRLFYTAGSSVVMNRVNTTILQNQTAFLNNSDANEDDIKAYNSKRRSQTLAIAIDNHGVMYFGDVHGNAVLCWNTKSCDYGRYIDMMYQNRTTMQFQSGIKVIDHPSGYQELWVLTSRFERIITNTLDPNDTNFRISVGKIPEVLKDTACAKPNQKPLKY